MAEQNINIGSVVRSLMEGAEGILTSKTVVGAPVNVGDSIVIPLSDVSIGCGAGSDGTDRKDKGAGGFSAKMSPTAVLIMRGGSTKIVNIKDQTALTKLVDMVPEMMDRAKKKKMISDEEAIEAAFPDVEV